MKANALALMALLLASACGMHEFILLTDAKAERGADDQVVVTATAKCEAVGSPDCRTAKEYCVEVTWVRQHVGADGGVVDGHPLETIDSARTCKSELLAHDQETTLTVPSTKAIPRGADIAGKLALIAPDGGTIGRDDFRKTLPSP